MNTSVFQVKYFSNKVFWKLFYFQFTCGNLKVPGGTYSWISLSFYFLFLSGLYIPSRTIYPITYHDLPFPHRNKSYIASKEIKSVIENNMDVQILQTAAIFWSFSANKWNINSFGKTHLSQTILMEVLFSEQLFMFIAASLGNTHATNLFHTIWAPCLLGMFLVFLLLFMNICSFHQL